MNVGLIWSANGYLVTLLYEDVGNGVKGVFFLKNNFHFGITIKILLN